MAIVCRFWSQRSTPSTVTLCPIVVHVRCGEIDVVIRNTGQKLQTDTTDWQKIARTALKELMKKSRVALTVNMKTDTVLVGKPPIHVNKEETTVES